jgi:hypothetical protein
MGYTPGPWEWDEEDGSIETPTGGAICQIAHHGNVNTIARTGQLYKKDDARLIAAAPKLLEALRAIVDQWEQTGDVGVSEFAAGRAAIAQATGDWGD